MEHSLEHYLWRQKKEDLEKLLQQYEGNNTEEEYNVALLIRNILAKKEKDKAPPLG